MGLSVRREQRDGREITVITGDVEGPDVVEELARMVRLVAQDQHLAVDMSSLTGLDDRQREEFVAAVDSLVEFTDPPK
ncbi:MAG: hypothetical protein ABJH68_07170 [Ilumatobacter sp.]|uniref:hypothetical protein n=1 Tax=Ilumatobacter sp. TaxID=1967498 RepID=UPI003297C8F9